AACRSDRAAPGSGRARAARSRRLLLVDGFLDGSFAGEAARHLLELRLDAGVDQAEVALDQAAAAADRRIRDDAHPRAGPVVAVPLYGMAAVFGVQADRRAARAAQALERHPGHGDQQVFVDSGLAPQDSSRDGKGE